MLGTVGMGWGEGLNGNEQASCFLQAQQSSSSLLHLPPPSLPCGGTSCGFLVDTEPVKRALSCLFLRHEEEVKVGDKLPVAVIGSLSPQGTFWVHVVPDNQWEQSTMMLNISIAMA